MTTEQPPKQINWSAVMSAAGAAIAALLAATHGKVGAGILDLNWAVVGPAMWAAAVAAYKGTARGSLSVKRKPQPALPANDEGI